MRGLDFSTASFFYTAMKINTNFLNRLRYTLYTPVYDSVAKIFSSSRKKAIGNLGLQAGDKVLLIGAGTGLDLEYIPKDCIVTATDLTPSMVGRIRKRNQTLGLTLETLVMDGQKLSLPDNSFDKVILHLILAVIPDPVACLQEVERVLEPGGKISVFDKFVPGESKLSLTRRMLNPLTNLLFSDITRRPEPIVSQTGLRIISDTPADFRGNFRILLVEKPVI